VNEAWLKLSSSAGLSPVDHLRFILVDASRRRSPKMKGGTKFRSPSMNRSTMVVTFGWNQNSSRSDRGLPFTKQTEGVLWAKGEEDPVYIYLRPGSYIPVFQSREDLADAPSSIEPDTFLARESSAVVIAILPFTDISGNCKAAIYARGIPDELAYVLMRNNAEHF
jgi:hypothetical protein